MSIAAAAQFLPLVDFLRPSKSPHLVAGSIGSVSLIISGNENFSDSRFLMVSIPIYLTLFLIVLFSFKDRMPTNTEDDIESNFRFSRAMGIASAAVVLVLAAIIIHKDNQARFLIIYTSALLQLITFWIYTGIRLVKEEPPSKYTVFQISFMMFVFLVAFTYCFAQADFGDTLLLKDTGGSISGDGAPPQKGTQSIDRYAVTGIIFFLLWIVYELYWLRRIWQLIEFNVREEET